MEGERGGAAEVERGGGVGVEGGVAPLDRGAPAQFQCRRSGPTVHPTAGEGHAEHRASCVQKTPDEASGRLTRPRRERRPESS